MTVTNPSSYMPPPAYKEATNPPPYMTKAVTDLPNKQSQLSTKNTPFNYLQSLTKNISTKQAAFATITVFAIATSGCAIAAATVVTTIATIAYSILTINAGAISIASISSWMVTNEKSTSMDYFNTFKNHAEKTLNITLMLTKQVFNAFMIGIATGIQISSQNIIVK